MQVNFVFVMFYLELIPRRRRPSRRLESFIHKPGKGEVKVRHPESERNGRRGFTCPNVLKLILITF
jgi:hypothetical protein